MDEVKEGWVFVDMPGESEPVLAARIVIDDGAGRLFMDGRIWIETMLSLSILSICP